MNDKAKRLHRLAIRMKDVQNLLNEDISVSPHHYPGILTETMGGPELKKKKHQGHDSPGPRGVAEVTDEEDES